ncbi:MAG TPA: ribonuclease H-like domain-containing protein [Patescibacteria group bacterium]|nr:ribonuclease H-like domain-containing protein [Patescibacteria group bacterium]
MIEYREDLRRELEALKKKAETIFKRAGRVGAIDLPLQRQGVERSPSRIVRPSGPLSELVPGQPVEAAGRGVFYRVLAGAEAIWQDTLALHREYLDALANPFQLEAAGLEPLLALKDLRPEEVCYLDLETTGLSMAPLFLVGLMYTDGDRLVVDQFFARDYTEEPAVLGFTGSFLERFRALVTFNGFRFDVPFLHERMTIAGIEFAEPGIHVDLLPIARKLLKKRTPDHKLQTLESFLCRRKRIGDMPGSEIPDVYHEFVRSGDAADIAAVFHHNRLDLLTMVQLVTIFLANTGEP